MPVLPVDASKFAGMSEEQQRTFPRRVVIGEHLTPDELARMPKMISTDSHVMEPEELWLELPKRLQEHLPKVPFRNSPPGATDPHLRLQDQDTDGVAAEILFPNYGMALFAMDDVETQQESFKLYNDWLTNFCSVDRKRLYGSPLVSCYDIQAGIKELHRGLSMGMKGCMIWQVPDPKLPFTSDHYEPLWAACNEAKAPVVCHILTGHSYIKTGQKGGVQGIKDAVNSKTNDSCNTLFDFIFSGAFDRYPDLKLLLAESEIGWLPFMLQQWDYYFERFRKQRELPIKRKPSEIFDEHVYGTFLEDYVGTRVFPWWHGTKNCMWSNDYPHFNMTFPNSREVAEYHLKGLTAENRERLTRDNAIKLFDLDI